MRPDLAGKGGSAGPAGGVWSLCSRIRDKGTTPPSRPPITSPADAPTTAGDQPSGTPSTPTALHARGDLAQVLVDHIDVRQLRRHRHVGAVSLGIEAVADAEVRVDVAPCRRRR